MEQRTQRSDLILRQLENLARKVQVQSPDFSELDSHIYVGDAVAGTYVIEISKGRLSKSVFVGPMAARQLESGHFDANLFREVRIAMLAVTRLAQDRK